MDLLIVILQLVLLLGILVIGLVIRKYLPAYLGEKGKNLATKEDIAEITAITEREKARFTTAIEELRHQLGRSSSDITQRQQLYIQLAESASHVFLSGRTATDEDRRAFLANYAAAFLVASDQVVKAVGAHLDIQRAVAALPPNGRAPLQGQLRETLAAVFLELRKESFHPETAVAPADYRFVSFE